MRFAQLRIFSGFSLVEMAIVLLILGIALNGLFIAAGQSTENTRRLEARNKLREIEEALYAFAQVQGRLPCPADDDTSGAEDINTANIANGNCNLQHGMLPNATLGLSGGVDDNGLLLDPWGNPYRYSVSGQTPGPGSSRRYTGTTGIQEIYDNADHPTNPTIVSGSNVLEVCNNTACSDVIMTNIAAAVVLTMGNNWATTASAEELENTDNDQTFVVTGYVEDNYDDMLTWIAPHLLFSKLIAAGKIQP